MSRTRWGLFKSKRYWDLFRNVVFRAISRLSIFLFGWRIFARFTDSDPK